VCILSLSRTPSAVSIIIFICLIVCFGLRVKVCRPVVAGSLLSLMTLAAALSQLIDMQLRPEHMSTRLDLSVRIISVPERSNRRTAFLAEVLSCESCENPFKPSCWAGGQTSTLATDGS
jgi:hypothetical protein